ncbi:two-component sensor histidine kinase [Azospirillum fermentarium]|uniref:sensor histidine kinase n=1 Tax=Azospirillum fermentarium TaxID=1233114 RepID=UPI0022263165|nr:DUF4118 domain-containing protein [Azospirillum fermentarium]MCW2244762.1 two-component sensor histidine kinase [Azospirillum fermentarium]
MAAVRPTWRGSIWQAITRFSLLESGAGARYGLAVALSGASLALRLAVDEMMPPGFPYVTFFPAVILTAFVAGVGPGILAAVLCGLAAWYFFIPPVFVFTINRPTLLAQGFYIAVVAVDIALIHAMQVAMRRLSAERARTAALLDRQTTMFHELQHRVANNMQFVSALLSLQRRSIGTTPESAAEALAEAGRRLETMAQVHRRLHDPQAGDDFAGHVDALCRDLLRAAGVEGVTCVVSVSAAPASPERLLALALLIVETLTNSLKHAFADGRGGTVRIGLHPQPGGPGRLRLEVTDDGCGLPAGFEAGAAGGLGWTIIRNLAGQLGGRLDIGHADGGGTRIVLDFSA